MPRTAASQGGYGRGRARRELRGGPQPAGPDAPRPRPGPSRAPRADAGPLWRTHRRDRAGRALDARQPGGLACGAHPDRRRRAPGPRRHACAARGGRGALPAVRHRPADRSRPGAVRPRHRNTPGGADDDD